METRILSLVIILGMSTFALLGQSVKTETFEVAGNCGMCKTRIDKAAKSVDGVVSADWDKETKMIEVTFNPEKADLQKIDQAIAQVGHDTKTHRAEDEVYDQLPGCCKYERMEQQKSE